MPTFKPAFDLDIFPILARALGYQWVNHFNRDAHGPGLPGDFTANPDLGSHAASNADRQVIFNKLRNPAGPSVPPGTPAMPALFSDDYFGNSKLVQPLTRSQFRVLQLWANGTFDDVGTPTAPQLEPDALTRFVLDACVGASFCPGIEAGRKLRSDIYAAGEAFRFDRSKLNAGDLTESMALPWQADFALCRWENGVAPDKGRGWWPAQRPDDVLLGPDDAAMVRWDRGADTEPLMVDNWHKLGVVLETVDSAGAPAFIETQRTL
jgi:hypothetical protein